MLMTLTKQDYRHVCLTYLNLKAHALRQARQVPLYKLPKGIGEMRPAHPSKEVPLPGALHAQL